MVSPRLSDRGPDFELVPLARYQRDRRLIQESVLAGELELPPGGDVGHAVAGGVYSFVGPAETQGDGIDLPVYATPQATGWEPAA